LRYIRAEHQIGSPAKQRNANSQAASRCNTKETILNASLCLSTTGCHKPRNRAARYSRFTYQRRTFSLVYHEFCRENTTPKEKRGLYSKEAGGSGTALRLLNRPIAFATALTAALTRSSGARYGVDTRFLTCSGTTSSVR
jgi:hypothetical protein